MGAARWRTDAQTQRTAGEAVSHFAPGEQLEGDRSAAARAETLSAWT